MTPSMRRVPHPLRWAVVWFLTVVVAFGATTTRLYWYQHDQCVKFRTEDAPAAFDSFARFLAERGGLTPEETEEALEQFHKDLEEDLPASEC